MLPSQHAVSQDAPNEYHITGTIDAHGPTVLATPRAELIAKVVSLSLTEGGGISYDFLVTADYSKADAADAAAAAKAKADAKEATAQAAASAQAAAEDAAAKEQADKDAADARLAKVVAAAVAQAVAPKA